MAACLPDETDDTTLLTTYLGGESPRRLLRRYVPGEPMGVETIFAAMLIIKKLLRKFEVAVVPHEALLDSSPKTLQRLVNSKDSDPIFFSPMLLSNPGHWISVFWRGRTPTEVLYVDSSESDHPALANTLRRVIAKVASSAIPYRRVDGPTIEDFATPRTCGVSTICAYAMLRMRGRVFPEQVFEPQQIPLQLSDAVADYEVRATRSSPQTAARESIESHRNRARVASLPLRAGDPSPQQSWPSQQRASFGAGAPLNGHDPVEVGEVGNHQAAPSTAAPVSSTLPTAAVPSAERAESLAAALHQAEARHGASAASTELKTLVRVISGLARETSLPDAVATLLAQAEHGVSGLLSETFEECLLRRCPQRFADVPGRYPMLDDGISDPCSYGPNLMVVPGTPAWHPTPPSLFAVGTKGRPPREMALSLVAGESGSGKSWEMLRMQPEKSFSIAIKLTNCEGGSLQVLPTEEEAELLRAKASTPGCRRDARLEAYRRRRDAYVEETIVGKVKAALKNRLREALYAAFEAAAPTTGLSYGLYIAVDEAGAYPEFLRGLIARRYAICSVLCTFFPRVSLVAGGTGVDMGEPDLGSPPHVWSVHFLLPVTIDFFSSAVRNLRLPEGFVAALVQRATFGMLVQNRRVACNAADILENLPPLVLVGLQQVVATSPESMAALADAAQRFLSSYSVLAYKQQNGLRHISPDAVGRLTSMALFAVLFAGRRCKQVAEEVRWCGELIASGLLTFSARCRSLGECVDETLVLCRGAAHTLVMVDAQHRGCFRATPAQALMMQLRYAIEQGCEEWRAFELCVGLFAQLLATALQHRPPTELRHLEGALSRFLNETLKSKGLAPQFTAEPGGREKTLLPDPRLTPGQVPIVELAERAGVAHYRPTEHVPGHAVSHFVTCKPSRFDGSSVALDASPSFRPELGRALVLMSARTSPFADVMLVFPYHSVFLIQVKDICGSLSISEVADELLKMGFAPIEKPSTLCTKRRAELQALTPSAKVHVYSAPREQLRVYLLRFLR